MINNKKIVAGVLLATVSLVLTAPVFSGNNGEFSEGRPLEIDYPEISGVPPLKTTDAPLAYYVRYVYNFAIISSGVIALIVLLTAGIQYLTSTGSPEKMKGAKKRILSVFWGIAILFGSYILLTTINPQMLSAPWEEPPPISYPKPSPPPNTPFPTKDLLGRIRSLAEAIKSAPQPLLNASLELKNLTMECDCQNTRAICLCTGGAPGASCEPRGCYAGGSAHPCPQPEEIKVLQKNIIDQKDLILYSRTRAISEKEDLERDIEEFLNYEIAWYNEQIEVEKEIISQSERGVKEVHERRAYELEQKRDWVKEKRSYKEDLIQKLDELSSEIALLGPPAEKIPQLSSQCFASVSEKCAATCKQGPTYGCHDRVEGCQPDKCQGGNPCPMGEIQNEISKISSQPKKIIALCDQIIAIVNNIKEEQTLKRSD